MNCQYSHLESDALLHIVGPDTLKFLQGQTTCDTRLVDAGHARPGVFCTPQGRAICDFLLCELGPDHFALRLRRDIRATSAAAFGKYIIFSKAQLDAVGEDWTLLGVWGADASGALAEIFGELHVPKERFAASSGEDYVLIQTDEAGEHFECYLGASSSEKMLNGMAQNMQAATEEQWQAQQISAGIARVESANVEQFVPQTLNYDLTGHISFKKGCYTGQEVVARLHYRGKPKRRSYLAEFVGEHDCAPGTEVFSNDSTRSVGNIVNSSTVEDKTLMLVAATAEGAANGLHLEAADGPALTLGKLPYELHAD